MIAGDLFIFGFSVIGCRFSVSVIGRLNDIAFERVRCKSRMLADLSDFSEFEVFCHLISLV